MQDALHAVCRAIRGAIPEAEECFEVSKGSIRLTYDREMPVELISAIAAWCYEND